MTDALLERASTLADVQVLLTGASGFVGSHLARALREGGARVTALVRSGGTDTRRLAGVVGDIDWVEVDLCDGTALTEAVRGVRPEVVFHLATHYAAHNEVDLAAMVDTNVKASALMVSACSEVDGLRLLANAGTCAEYGDFREPADEDTRLDPNNVYASTKAAQTLIVQQLGRDLDVPTTTLRLYNMYGEWERPFRLVPSVALSLLRKERIELTGCEQAKDYSYVGDIAAAFLAAASQPDAAAGEVFNIGSGRTVPVRQVVEEIASHFSGAESLLAFGARPYRPDEMWFQGTSTDKARRLLGWESTTGFSDGIASTIAWYREHAGEYGHHDD